MDRTLFILAAALLLDRLLGEPNWLWSRLPHPVVLVGRAIGWFDRQLNDAALPFADRRRRGVLAVAVLAGASLLAGSLLGEFADALVLGWLAEIAVVSILLAQKSLLDHVGSVAAALRRDGLAAGRQEVAKIVGRDVSGLDRSGVSRAAIESLAENYSDGLVAPALWYAVLGLPGLFLFKLVNTADSMIGHRSARYEAFGWAAARLDDLLNLFPARLAALTIVAAAAFTGLGGRDAFMAARLDAPKHKSPNAGWPEAAAAGALGLALGGPRTYGDSRVEGVWLNASGRTEAGTRDIYAALHLVEWAWGIVLALVLIAASAALL